VSNPQELFQKDRFHGETLFIIGTAPSITVEQMRLVESHHTFGHGGLCHWAARPYWPEFYGVSEEPAYLHYKSALEPSPCALALSIPVGGAHYPQAGNMRYYKFFSPMKFDRSRWLILDAPHTRFASEVGFSPVDVDAEQGVRARLSSSFNTPVQVGAWLGFKKMYLIGVDISNDGYIYQPNHSRSITGDWDRESESLQRWLSRQGATLVNCSPGYKGRELPGLEYQPLSDVLGLSLPPDTMEWARTLCEGLHHNDVLSRGRFSIKVELTEYATVSRIKYGDVVLATHCEDNIKNEHNKRELLAFLGRFSYEV
jgi:hypothetical protein